MKFTSIIPAAVAVFSAVATASPVHVARDANGVSDALATISNQTVELNEIVTDFEGGIKGLIPALKIQSKSKKLEGTLGDAIDAAKDSEKFTKDESYAISEAVINFEPKVSALLKEMSNKKPEFDDVLFGLGTKLAKKSLEKQKDLSGELGDAIVDKLIPELADLAPIINDKIAAAFEKALEVFNA